MPITVDGARVSAYAYYAMKIVQAAAQTPRTAASESNAENSPNQGVADREAAALADP